MKEDEKKVAMAAAALIESKLKGMTPEEAEKYLSTIKIEGDCIGDEE